MNVLGKEMAANTFAETQLVRIIVYVETDIIFIKMEKRAWVGNDFIFIKMGELASAVILHSLKPHFTFTSCYYCRQRVFIHLTITAVLTYANCLL